MTTRASSQPSQYLSHPWACDAPPTHDDEQTHNLRTLLERARWTHDCFYASNVPPYTPRSSEKWIFTSHDGTMFEGMWHRHTYAPNGLGGTEIVCGLRSRPSPIRDETVVEWFGTEYKTVIDGNMRARREAIIAWLTRQVSLRNMPRPTPTSRDWRLAVIREGCTFAIVASTEGPGGRIHKPLVRAQGTVKGMEVLLFYDRPAPYFSSVMDGEMGLVNLVILYFALMRFDLMPPPALPPKAQQILDEQYEREMALDDSDEDDDYFDEENGTVCAVDDVA